MGLGLYQKLKECKTIGEIYETLGEEWFSRISSYILLAWLEIPLIAGIIDMIIHFIYKEYSLFTLSKFASYYTWLVTVIGSLSIVFWIFSVMASLGFKKITFYRALNEKYQNEIWIVLLLFMWGWSFLSALLAPRWGNSFGGTEFRFDGFCTYCMYAGAMGCAYYVKKRELADRFIKCFIIVGLVLAIIMIGSEKEIPILEESTVSWNTSIFMNSNHYGYFLAMAVMISAGFFFSRLELCEDRNDVFKDKWLIISLISFTVQTFALMKNDTMGAYVAIVFAMIISLALWKGRGVKIGALHLLPIAILALFTVLSMVGVITAVLGETIGKSLKVLWADIFKIARKSEDMEQAGTNRIFLWKHAIDMIKKKPLFGWGPEGLQGEYKAITGLDRPHNEYLQHAAFLGIPAAVMYLGALFSLLIDRCKKVRNLTAEQLIAGGAVIAYLISAFFGNTIFYTTPYLFILLGLVTSGMEDDKEKC